MQNVGVSGTSVPLHIFFVRGVFPLFRYVSKERPRLHTHATVPRECPFKCNCLHENRVKFLPSHYPQKTWWHLDPRKLKKRDREKQDCIWDNIKNERDTLVLSVNKRTLFSSNNHRNKGTGEIFLKNTALSRWKDCKACNYKSVRSQGVKKPK